MEEVTAISDYALMAVDEPEPWDRRADESANDFHSFTIYRNLGAKRTFATTARTLGILPANVFTRAKEYDWRDRAAAWDFYMDRIFQAELVERQRVLAKTQFEMAEKSLKALNAPVEALLAKMEADPEGTMAEFGAKDIARLLKMAQDSIRLIPATFSAQRLALGQPTDITEKTETRNINYSDPQRIGEVLDVLHEAGVLDAFVNPGEAGSIIDAEVVEVDDDRSDTEADSLPDSSQ